MRSRLNGVIPPQLSYESQFGLFLALTVPGGIPSVPIVEPGTCGVTDRLRLRTFRVEWHLGHFSSSIEMPRFRMGMGPIAPIGATTISWKRKFFWVASHCMYSMAFGCEPG